MVDHPVVVRGTELAAPYASAVNTAPVVLLRTDKNFVQGVLDGLRTEAGRAALLQSEINTQTTVNVRDASNVLKLYQPVHQVFQVAVVEAICDSFRSPRLDPNKIDSCGMVVRRISASDPNVLERWSRMGSAIQGWVACNDDDVDPDPARRKPLSTTGNAAIDKLLPIPLPAYAPFTETAAPLFIAPPDVCSAAKATVLYGVVPVTSTEKSEAPRDHSLPGDFIQSQLPYFLQNGGSLTVPRANDTLTAGDASDPALLPVITSLRVLKFQFGVLDPQDPLATAIFNALNQFTVKDVDGNDLAALGDFLVSASSVLVDQGTDSIQMPNQWPAMADTDRAILASQFQKVLEGRLAKIVTGQGRFEGQGSQYRLRAFIRVKRDDGCPPLLMWTGYSEPFTIAQWHESAGLPPVRISLPEITPDFLKSLKPNVAFGMPASLFNALQRDAKQTLQGNNPPGGASVGVLWICSFSIPLITICAFIVLNIFLSLFNIIFSWMLFIKICLPIPIPKKNG